jgi:hypothetical protein
MHKNTVHCTTINDSRFLQRTRQTFHKTGQHENGHWHIKGRVEQNHEYVIITETQNIRQKGQGHNNALYGQHHSHYKKYADMIL